MSFEPDCSWTPSFNDAGTYSATVTASDGVSSSSKTFTLEVIDVNRPPILSTIPNITAKAGDLIKINATATDPDDDPVTINYPKYDNVNFNSSGEWQTTIDDAGVYYLEVSATDDKGKADAKSFILTLLLPNTPPTVQSVTITPENATTNDDLYCIPVNASDDNTTSLTYFIKWYKNKEYYASGTASATGTGGEWFISHSNTSEWDEWQCSITPNDGELNGSTVFSQAIVIKNAPTALTNPFQPLPGEENTAGTGLGSSNPSNGLQNTATSTGTTPLNPSTTAAAGATAFFAAIAAGAYIEKRKTRTVVMPKTNLLEINKDWYDYLYERAHQPKYPPVPSIKDYKPDVITLESTIPDVEITPVPEPSEKGFEQGSIGTNSAYYKMLMANEELLLNSSKYFSIMQDDYTDISNESALSKIARGWGMTFGNVWNGITGFVGGIANNPSGAIKGAGEAIWNGITGIGNWMVERQKTNFELLAKGGILGFLYRQTGADLIVKGAVAYGNALINNPIETLAKTAIFVGGITVAAVGILGAPVSGGASLLLTAAALSAIGGSVTLTVKDSYEYANAKTEEELTARAQENTDDVGWIVGGAITGWQGLSMASKINYVRNVVSTSEWNPSSLEKHAFKHLKNNPIDPSEPSKWARLGITTKEQYAKVTKEVMEEAINKGKAFSYVNRYGNKMIGFYDESKKIFVSMSVDGRTVTSFIPKEGINYINSLDDIIPLTTKNMNLVKGGYVPLRQAKYRGFGGGKLDKKFIESKVNSLNKQLPINKQIKNIKFVDSSVLDDSPMAIDIKEGTLFINKEQGTFVTEYIDELLNHEIGHVKFKIRVPEKSIDKLKIDTSVKKEIKDIISHRIEGNIGWIKNRNGISMREARRWYDFISGDILKNKNRLNMLINSKYGYPQVDMDIALTRIAEDYVMLKEAGFLTKAKDIVGLITRLPKSEQLKFKKIVDIYTTAIRLGVWK